jgi:hypothetical protein
MRRSVPSLLIGKLKTHKITSGVSSYQKKQNMDHALTLKNKDGPTPFIPTMRRLKTQFLLSAHTVTTGYSKTRESSQKTTKNGMETSTTSFILPMKKLSQSGITSSLMKSLILGLLLLPTMKNSAYSTFGLQLMMFACLLLIGRTLTTEMRISGASLFRLLKKPDNALSLKRMAGPMPGTLMMRRLKLLCPLLAHGATTGNSWMR